MRARRKRACACVQASVLSTLFVAFMAAATAIPGGTKIGPILKVRIVKIIEKPGLEISIPSTIKHETTSCVVNTRETERLVDEIHDRRNELRSSCAQPFRRKRTLRRKKIQLQ